MKINIELLQKQTLSQKMIQSTQILQMNSQELEKYINETALENPIIDLDTDSGESREEILLRRKNEWQRTLGSHNNGERVYYQTGLSDEKNMMDNVSADDEGTIQDYIQEQLLTKNFNSDEMRIAEYIMGCLDHRGYFTDSIKEASEMLNTSEEKFEDVLAVMQTLDPPGICAGNIKECLKNQIKEDDDVSHLAVIIIENYLDFLAKNQLGLIAKKICRNIDDITKACEKIKSLTPKPANAFNSKDSMKYIIPDVIVVKLNDYYEILINDYYYPKIKLNNYYKNMLKEDAPDDVKEYIDTKIKQAEWIKQCITQRNSTLIKVVKCIVENQPLFFAMGQGCLKPMLQSDIAEIINVHESTISRAIKEKYLQCSWGVYPLSYFFKKGISSNVLDGMVSIEKVEKYICNIIDNEDKKNPLSDAHIAEMLSEKGIKISRRTVAKYRNRMNIIGAAGRKKYN